MQCLMMDMCMICIGLCMIYNGLANPLYFRFRAVGKYIVNKIEYHTRNSINNK